MIISIRPSIRCLFISGYTADIISKNGIIDTGIHFLEKPFSTEALSVKIREALSSTRSPCPNKL